MLAILVISKIPSVYHFFFHQLPTFFLPFFFFLQNAEEHESTFKITIFICIIPASLTTQFFIYLSFLFLLFPSVSTGKEDEAIKIK